MKSWRSTGARTPRKLKRPAFRSFLNFSRSRRLDFALRSDAYNSVHPVCNESECDPQELLVERGVMKGFTCPAIFSGCRLRQIASTISSVSAIRAQIFSTVPIVRNGINSGSMIGALKSLLLSAAQCSSWNPHREIAAIGRIIRKRSPEYASTTDMRGRACSGLVDSQALIQSISWKGVNHAVSWNSLQIAAIASSDPTV